MSRQHFLVDRVIEQFELELSGLTVLTEAASGAYALNPFIAAKAGAKVFCVVKDSRFATKDDVKKALFLNKETFGLGEESVEAVNSPFDAPLHHIDMVTNSGFVRPINEQLVSQLKSTCVIPLMWETWEFRESDFDLKYCQQRDILCLGTDESVAPLAMDPYAGILAVKMLFDLNLEVYKNKVVLLGENRFAWRIYNYLKLAGCEIHWFSKDVYPVSQGQENIYNENAFREWFELNGEQVDAILLADLVYDDNYSNVGAPLEPGFIKAINPFINIGVLAGVLDTNLLLKEDINVHPQRIMPAHFMSYQLYDIGPKPIMELFAAGLKVGQIMSMYRRQGLPVREAAKASLQNNPLVMDFEGELSWV